MLDGTVQHAEAARPLMKHRTAFYCYIFACVRSHHDADDVLQNVSHVCPTVVNGRYRHVK